MTSRERRPGAFVLRVVTLSVFLLAAQDRTAIAYSGNWGPYSVNVLDYTGVPEGEMVCRLQEFNRMAEECIRRFPRKKERQKKCVREAHPQLPGQCR